jgi:DNA repair protein SbcD/Mre11
MNPVRFIHTSDIHLDTGFSGAGFSSRLGDRKREAIRGTFRRMMEDARLHEVSFILIAGDLYESERVTADTIEFLKQQFEGLKDIPIFIAPGNHDPCIKGSPYREGVWPSNVHIFDAEEFQSVELSNLSVRITGFGFNRTILEERFFQRLPVLSKDRINVVLAHASDISRVPAGKSKHGPFILAEIAEKNVQYCALGHYHQQHQVANPLDDAQIWYSGIPEGRGWDEEGGCGYLLCSIDESGIRVESHICSQFNFNSLSVDCETFSTREQILDAILQYKNKKYDSRTLLRICLTGALDPRLDLSLSELEERLAGECLFIQWDDQTCPALDFETLAQEKTLRGRFVRVLSERIASASETDRLILERARLYGVQALSGREVRLR